MVAIVAHTKKKNKPEVDYTVDPALLTNTPAQAEYVVHSPE